MLNLEINNGQVGNATIRHERQSGTEDTWACDVAALKVMLISVRLHAMSLFFRALLL